MPRNFWKTKSASSSSRRITSKPAPSHTLSDLRGSREVWYKLLLLIHDLHNIRKSKASLNRTEQTTDPLYISAPYFTPSEAEFVKATLVAPVKHVEIETFADDDQTDSLAETTEQKVTAESAITHRLQNFLSKRRASGDARPCGPHDLGPLYLAVFGVERAEIEDEKFLRRVAKEASKNHIQVNFVGMRTLP